MAASSSADGSSGADSSCFCEKVANLQLQLSPAYLGNEDAGVREQLRLALLRYVDSLGGVVVSYSELRFTSPLGTIREDAPHIHVNVSVRVVLFAPRVGQRLDDSRGVGIRFRRGQVRQLAMQQLERPHVVRLRIALQKGGHSSKAVVAVRDVVCDRVRLAAVGVHDRQRGRARATKPAAR